MTISKNHYKVWRKILRKKFMPDNIIYEIKQSLLRGRGGAGFLTGLKLELMKNNKSTQKYLICNLSEGEPGTFKDRDILCNDAHQLIEGILIASYTIGATVAYNYIKGELVKYIDVLENAMGEAKAAKLIPDYIELNNFCTNGGYIYGEETALIRAIEGKSVEPTFKPPFPTEFGLYKCPTLVCNAETLALIPIILEKGAKWHVETGGYKIFSISGDVNKPGNYKLPLGVAFSEILNLAGGICKNRKLKAIFPGGISTPILPYDIIIDLKMDYESLQNAGSMLGTGAIIVMDEDTCMVSKLNKILRFYYDESCKKCTPCREGLAWLVKILDRIIKGSGNILDVNLLDNVADKILGNTLCALGDSAALVTKSFIKYFHNEFTSHIERI